MAIDNDVFVIGVKLNRDQLVAMLDEVKGKLEFDLKIRSTKKQLGNVLAALPPKVNPQIDRMVERDLAAPPLKRPRGGKDYQPIPGTAPHAIMQAMKNGPVSGAAEMIKLCSKFEPRAVSTAWYLLRNRGWLKKSEDGSWDLGPEAPRAKAKAKPKPAAKKKPPKPKVLPAFLPDRASANGKGDQA